MSIRARQQLLIEAGWPDPRSWDVPLEWDLFHVQDQLSGWSEEREAIKELYWANELHFLEEIKTAFEKYFIGRNPRNYLQQNLPELLRFKYSDVRWVDDGDNLDGAGGEAQFIGAELVKWHKFWASRFPDTIDTGPREDLEKLIQVMTERQECLTRMINRIENSDRAEKLKRSTFVKGLGLVPIYQPDFILALPKSKDMALIIQKMEAREQKLRIRQERHNTSSVGSDMMKPMNTMLQSLQASQARDRSIINSITQENKELQETCVQLRCEKAALEERCAQNSSTITQLEQDNRSLKGELADLRYYLAAPRPNLDQHHEGPCMIDVLAEGDERVAQTSDISLDRSAAGWDLVSVTSSHSWISVAASSGPHCWLEGSVFKTLSGDIEHYLKVEELRKGSQVLSHNNAKLEVVRNPQRSETDKLVELRTAASTLYVTPDHRVPVFSSDSEGFDMQAKDLRVGYQIFEDLTPQELISVEFRVLEDKVPVWGITFKPDMPVAVFMVPPAIASKGYAKKHLRRPGMNRRGKPGSCGDHAHFSIPDTAEGESDLPELCRKHG